MSCPKCNCISLTRTSSLKFSPVQSEWNIMYSCNSCRHRWKSEEESGKCKTNTRSDEGDIL